ncbi:MAG: hypothetical protein EP346_01800 [Bacteroidetes bacterium]|nr:MAG: hypothetical protein EP346_01800 [Bacteroidota bacterium]
MKYLLSLAFLLSTLSISAQLEYNVGVDTTSNSNPEILHFLKGYLDEMMTQAEAEPQSYFLAEDVEKFVEPDYIMKLIGGRNMYQHTRKTVLSIRDFDDYTRVQVLFSVDVEGYPFQVYGVGNYYVTRINGDWKLRVPAAVLTEDWHSAAVRHIHYHFPPYHSFNRVRAMELSAKVEKLESDWGVEPIDIEYYFADTQDEIEALKGFDYNIFMAKNTAAGGFAFVEEGYTFSSGWGEGYFHEIVHIYLNRLYPNSPLQEGIAVYYGGSMGQEATWHYGRLADYLKEHPEISPSSPDFYYMDDKTNPQTTLAASICSYVFEKEGLAGLKRLMDYTDIKELYASEFDLHSTDEIDAFLRDILVQLSE